MYFIVYWYIGIRVQFIKGLDKYIIIIFASELKYFNIHIDGPGKKNFSFSRGSIYEIFLLYLLLNFCILCGSLYIVLSKGVKLNTNVVYWMSIFRFLWYLFLYYNKGK